MLDGYPRTYENAKNIFMALPPAIEGQEENTGKVINETALPTKMFILEATDEYILNTLKHLPESQLVGHLNENDTRRRLKVYRKRNESNTGL